jgi:hypothetical protein
LYFRILIMKTEDKKSGGKNSKNGITLHNLIQKTKQIKSLEQIQSAQRKRETHLKEFRADSRTVFLSRSKEKAERIIGAYKRKQTNYKQI